MYFQHSASHKSRVKNVITHSPNATLSKLNATATELLENLQTAYAQKVCTTSELTAISGKITLHKKKSTKFEHLKKFPHSSDGNITKTRKRGSNKSNGIAV